jgi:hypothetical protein
VLVVRSTNGFAGLQGCWSEVVITSTVTRDMWGELGRGEGTSRGLYSIVSCKLQATSTRATASTQRAVHGDQLDLLQLSSRYHPPRLHYANYTPSSHELCCGNRHSTSIHSSRSRTSMDVGHVRHRLRSAFPPRKLFSTETSCFRLTTKDSNSKCRIAKNQQADPQMFNNHIGISHRPQSL